MAPSIQELSALAVSPPPPEIYTQSPSTAPYTVVPIPQKGLSVLSTRSLPSGTHLVTASPLLLLHTKAGCTPELILGTFAGLSAETKATYLQLCHGLPERPRPTKDEIVLGVWKCNNFCLDDEGTVNAVFDLPSRLNHACVGGENCVWRWDAEEEVVTFETDREVEVCATLVREEWC